MLIWALWLLLAVNCWGQALGTWKMIPAKSRQSSGPLAQAITVKYEARSKEAHPKQRPGRFTEMRTDGISETTSQTLRFDGKEYPCGDLGLEERPDTVVSTKLDARTAEVSYKKSGRVTRRVVRTVSADGKQMTLEVRIIPENGPAAEHLMVFGDEDDTNGSGGIRTVRRFAGGAGETVGHWREAMHSRIWSLAAAVVLAAATQAQTSRGTVSGTIMDPSGAVVIGATVVLTHTEAGVRRTAISNDAGIYRFDAVDLGRYELKVTQQGFRPFLATAFGVEANRTTTIDVRLEVGAVDQQVTVSAESAEMLVKDGPLRGGNFLPREVRDLPLIGLNPLSLARTLPGVIQTSGSCVYGNGWEAVQFSRSTASARAATTFCSTAPKTTTSPSPARRSRSTSPTPSRRSPCKPATSASSSAAPAAACSTSSPSPGQTAFTGPCCGAINRSASTRSPTWTS